MRARVAALATAVLTAAGMLTAFTPGPATAQGSFGAFQAYANGTKQHARIIDAGGQTLADTPAPQGALWCSSTQLSA